MSGWAFISNVSRWQSLAGIEGKWVVPGSSGIRHSVDWLSGPVAARSCFPGRSLLVSMTSGESGGRLPSLLIFISLSPTTYLSSTLWVISSTNHLPNKIHRLANLDFHFKHGLHSIGRKAHFLFLSSGVGELKDIWIKGSFYSWSICTVISTAGRSDVNHTMFVYRLVLWTSNALRST